MLNASRAGNRISVQFSFFFFIEDRKEFSVFYRGLKTSQHFQINTTVKSQMLFVNCYRKGKSKGTCEFHLRELWTQKQSSESTTWKPPSRCCECLRCVKLICMRCVTLHMHVVTTVRPTCCRRFLCGYMSSMHTFYVLVSGAALIWSEVFWPFQANVEKDMLIKRRNQHINPGRKPSRPLSTSCVDGRDMKSFFCTCFVLAFCKEALPMCVTLIGNILHMWGMLD